MLVPAAAHAQAASTDSASNDIAVFGHGLPLPPGTPAYGTSLIDRDRPENSASGRLEDVLPDVAGLQEGGSIDLGTPRSLWFGFHSLG